MKIIDLKKIDFLKIQEDFLKQKNSLIDPEDISFLQSFQWAEIQEKCGEKIILKSLEINDKKIGFFLAIEKKIWNSNKYWYLPRGPIFFDKNQSFWSDFFLSLKEEMKNKKLKFIRLEPVNNNFLDYYSTTNDLIKTTDIQPSKTSFLNLELSEDDLLKKMAQKTRYNVRLAKKKGLKFLELGPNGYEEFWKLIATTSKRDNFFIHSKKYYQNLIEYNNSFIKLLAASFQGDILAIGIFSFFGSTVSYLHGASSNSYRNLMSPYLLHWELIKQAKKDGFKYYDFYGVDEKKWPGVSRFKNGFNGQSFCFPGTFDYVINKRFYLMYKFFRQVKRRVKKIFFSK